MTFHISFESYDIISFRMDLHQISRFLTADEYERLIYNHRRSYWLDLNEREIISCFEGIRTLLEELGCSTSSNGHDEPTQSSIVDLISFSLILFSFKRKKVQKNVVVEPRLFPYLFEFHWIKILSLGQLFLMNYHLLHRVVHQQLQLLHRLHPLQLGYHQLNPINQSYPCHQVNNRIVK